MAEFSIRHLRADEIDIAAAIHRRAMMTVTCFDETLHTAEEDRAFWREQVFPHCDVLGVYGDARLLGQAAFGKGWLHHLFVEPEWHGRGLGSALVHAVQQQLADIQLWTFQANLGARRFYERHGFIAMQFTDGAGNEEREPDVRYRWCR